MVHPERNMALVVTRHISMHIAGMLYPYALSPLLDSCQRRADAIFAYFSSADNLSQLILAAKNCWEKFSVGGKLPRRDSREARRKNAHGRRQGVLISPRHDYRRIAPIRPATRKTANTPAMGTTKNRNTESIINIPIVCAISPMRD
jgi:hypothetical protein